MGFALNASSYDTCSNRVNPQSIREGEKRPVSHYEAVSETAGSDGSCVQWDNYLPAVHETPTVVAQDQGVLTQGRNRFTRSRSLGDAYVL